MLNLSISKFLKKARQTQEELAHQKPEVKSLRKGEDGDEAIWLTSYADLMTLLCAFFIMMMSTANFDTPRYEKVKEGLAKHFGGDYESAGEQTAKFVSQVIQEAGIEKDAVVFSDPNGTTITFHSTFFFDTLSANIKPKGMDILKKLTIALLGRQDAEQKKYKIVVEGHTDGRPILSGIYPSNWELSGARASQVLRRFIDTGFDPTQLLAIGYGSTRPQKKERNPDGSWDINALDTNRRVVLKVLEPHVENIPWDSPSLQNIDSTSKPKREISSTPSGN
ncbi:MAG: hypothetical protein CL678_14425 [Bdellovibrionaceae bacterium]|nr:hypothetical protein [Pseudobdellovibrionaceae bacterium]